MTRAERILLILGWKRDDMLDDWISPDTLIGYDFEQACNIEKDRINKITDFFNSENKELIELLKEASVYLQSCDDNTLSDKIKESLKKKNG